MSTDPLNGKPWQVMHGDCLELLRSLPDGCVSAVVTDPPYGLSDHKPGEVEACLRAWLAGEPYEPKGKGFMGKSWDAWVPGPEVWREVLRVLKPGGHTLVFAGTRSMDLMSMGLRLAGFEIRDAIGNAHSSAPSAHDSDSAPLAAWVYASGFPKSHNLSGEWEGWGSALKPAWEPIVLARKPLEGTIAQNVEKHGCGALNIDGCRIGTETVSHPAKNAETSFGAKSGADSSGSHKWNGCGAKVEQGRWPANVVHDGSEEVEEAFARFGEKGGGFGKRGKLNGGATKWGFDGHGQEVGYGDSGTASRFFFCGKATKQDRDEGLEEFEAWRGGMVSNTSGKHITRRDPEYKPLPSRKPHPTVKPTSLMQWLVRLITPPGGIVLDPFTGSGSTGKAAVLEGFRFLGMELDESYCQIARARIAAAAAQPRFDFTEQEQAPRPKAVQVAMDWDETADPDTTTTPTHTDLYDAPKGITEDLDTFAGALV